MNIAIFTNNYLPNPYGVTGSIESFRKELEKAGHTVYIFAPKWKDYLDRGEKTNFSGGQVFRYPAIMTNIKFKFPIPIPFSRRMDKIIQDLNIDIIHSQHPNLLGNAGMKWARKKGIPIVFTWHTLYDKYTGFISFIPEKVAANWIIKRAVKYANKSDAVVVPTDSVEFVIKEWGVKNKNIRVIPTGVDADFFEDANGEAIREKYEIPRDEILLLTVSRLTSEKNVEFLAEKIINVLNDNPKTKWLIVGGGYLTEKLKKMIEEKEMGKRIFFSGEIKRSEVKDYYAAGDIFVYASKSETQGMIFCEAMFAGLPIVALKATGAQDIIKDGATGFLSKEENFEKSIEKVIENRELRTSFSEKAKKIALSEYSSSVSVRKMLELYNSLIVEE